MLILTQEKFLGHPLSPQSISFGKLSVQNASAFFLIDSKFLVSGNIIYQTLTLNLEGYPVASATLTRPTAANFGTQTFRFRNKTWTLTDVVQSSIYAVNGNQKYYSYTITGVDFDNPEVSVG